ncbi:response regulator transcription factor [Microbacterium sp.]|uniref:response regulator transcription factor n=1 Tax=Microbacterium sp. TaxID=51671 RepID=UPI002618FF23|nr:response regulator transcription factor [Microbacterium sp.]MCV0336179.1 response regulator transcription factor [Microbacterium sp.]MCV0377107.1 response regulator transcription factor [Microbacterium sp.]MCV0390390.1 response regulator transcription factor [Microbacterium sp.]MCV0418125.1 response regulator transcription factor [Microbacterium sp.]MCV0422207.1 response regulator transcription factor [Microbacterium sp.]
MTPAVDRALVAVIVEDDPDVRSLLEEVFLAAGFETILTGSGLEGLAAIEQHQPVITTLDINLPGIDGFEVARRIRRISDTFIIMLSALSEESDVVLGLTSGADEYLVKPFRPRELRARIEALLRRPRVADPRPSEPRPSEPRSVLPRLPETGRAAVEPDPAADGATVLTWRGRVHRDLSLDLDTRMVLIGQRRVDLTPTEFDLLAMLLEAGLRVRSKADLARGLRGAPEGSNEYVSEPDKRAIETHIANLRRKLRDSTTQPRYIETVRGVGYRLTPADGP